MRGAPFPYEEETFRDAAGAALRPGGLAATAAVLDRCGWPAEGKIADVGCGRGGTLRLLRERGFRARGFDLSPAMVAEAAAYSGCPVETADARSLPLPDGSLDGAVCECLMSLFSDPEALLGELHRVLAPGGALLLTSVVAADGGGKLPAPAAVDLLLHTTGFTIRHEVDLDRTVAALAAQLLWRGCGRDEMNDWLGSAGRGLATKGVGYRQWIAAG